MSDKFTQQDLADLLAQRHEMNPADAEAFVRTLFALVEESVISDKYVKLTEQYSKTFKQAGLKTIEEKDNSNNETVGVTLATISQYTPEEFYKDKTLFEDWDEIGDYFERHVCRPMENIMTGSETRDKEFFVPENSGGEEDE